MPQGVRCRDNYHLYVPFKFLVHLGPRVSLILVQVVYNYVHVEGIAAATASGSSIYNLDRPVFGMYLYR